MSDIKEKRLGFIGMGAMGFPICCGLVRNGFSIMLPMWRYESSLMHGYSPLAPDKESKEKMYRWLLTHGALEAHSQQEMLQNVDVLLLCLPKSKQVEEIISGENGVLTSCKKGTIVIDLTSADFYSTQKLAKELEAKGMFLLDAPVSGGPKGASEQTLSVMVGGRKDIYDLCYPILSVIGKPEKVNYIGENGLGDLLKSCNNFLTATTLIASSQALAVCAKAGIDPRQAAKIIAESSGGNFALAVRFPQIIFPGNQWNFTLELMEKDVGLFQSAAEQLELTDTLGTKIRRLLQEYIAASDENADLTEIPKAVGKSADVQLYGIDSLEE